LDAPPAYMALMERLYAGDLAVAVAADDGNDGGGGRGGKASAPGSDSITCVNCQAMAAAVEEEEEEGAVARNGNRAANGDGGPVVHGNREDGDESTAPHTGRMTTTIAVTATGGGSGLSRTRQVGSSQRGHVLSLPIRWWRQNLGRQWRWQRRGNSNRKNGGGGNTKAEENLHLRRWILLQGEVN
jgi:hypothetical protein